MTERTTDESYEMKSVSTDQQCPHTVITTSELRDGSYGRSWCANCGETMPRPHYLDGYEDGSEDFDPYEAIGESRFGLPGGGKSL